MAISWIPYSVFEVMTADEIALYRRSLPAGDTLGIAIDKDPWKNTRLSDFEEYAGEASDRRLDAAGYNLVGKWNR